MDERERPHLWGRERRYMLTELLWERGPMTVAELAATLAADGWCVGGRPSKTISDALRWEIAHGRVARLGRGLYGPGRMPKQTRSWIRCRNRRTRAEAGEQLAADRHGEGRSETAETTGTTRTAGVAHKCSGMHPVVSGWSRPSAPRTAADPARPRARASRCPEAADDEIVIVGGGWSEADDAAEDEALRQRLLAKLQVSGGST